MKIKKAHISELKSYTGIKLNINSHSNETSKFHLVSDMIVPIILYLGIVTFIQSSFHLSYENYYVYIVGIVTIFGWCLLHKKKTERRYLLLGFFSIYIILIIMNYKLFINGFIILVNNVLDVIGMNKGIMYFHREVTIDIGQYRLAYVFFMILFNFLISIMAIKIHENNKRIFLSILVIALYIIKIWWKLDTSMFSQALLFVSLLSIYSGTFLFHKRKNVKNYKYIIFAIIAFCMIFLLGVNHFISKDRYENSSVVTSFKYRVDNFIEGLRYEKRDMSLLPEGDFRKIKNLTRIEEPALKVVMDKPESLYLRGYVGDIYTSNEWTNFDNEKRYDNYKLFYWLHQSEFNSLNQISTVNKLIDEKVDNTISMTVNNINGNSKYIYTPYELSTPGFDIKDTTYSLDSNVESNKILGSRFYSYKTNHNLVKNYTGLAQQFYGLEEENDESYKEYNELEGWYNQYVYENYLEIPEEIKDLFKYQLGELIYNGDSHVGYEEAKKIVIDFLGDNVSYSEEVKSVPKDKDFLTYFLKENKEGYSVHYATAATMLFRYLGIPARYVEGYLITPSDIYDAKPYDEITINENNAHSWAEIYIDKVGWIPVEVTPPYMDIMEHPEEEYLTAGGSYAENNNTVKKTSDLEISEDSEENDAANDHQIFKLNYVLIVIIILLLVFLMYFINARYKVFLRKKALMDSSNRVRVNRMFMYALIILNYDKNSVYEGSLYNYEMELSRKYSKEYGKRYADNVHIFQEAMYSEHEISDLKVKEMSEFLKDTFNLVVENKNIFKRFKMKYIDFIY